MSITIQITRNAINAIVSGETEITPEKIVSLSGQTYDKYSNYIFEIKEDITIPIGKTLKGFDNIVVNPTTKNITIKNGGTIEDCIITLNTNDNGYYCSIISNGYVDGNNNFEGNIINCHITLFGNSWIDNGDGGIGNITGGSITLKNNTNFYNGNGGVGNITGCFITLEDNSEFYNDSYTLNNCIFINGSAKLCNFYNYKDNNGNIITTKYGTLKDNYIFADDTSTIQNSYDNKPGVFNNTYLRFSSSSNIDITEYQSLLADSFTLGKTIMSYLNKQFSELKKTITDKNNVNSLASKINTLNTNYSDLKKATTDKNNVNSLASQISKLEKNTVGADYTDKQSLFSKISDLTEATTDKNNDNSLASQISNLTEATTDKNNKDSLASQISKLEKNTVGVNYTDEHSLFSKINNLTKTTTDKDNSLASQIRELSTRVGGLESTTNSLEVNEIALQIEGLSKDIEELVKRIQMLFYNLPNDMSEQLVNKSSDSIQKLLLLLLLNKSNNDLTSNINRLLKQ